ncbi:MAG: hypothetical protein N3F63_02610 [Thermoplasmata archaeon]|nr:hypothetical protein [Thermoplasmata archaeon]
MESLEIYQKLVDLRKNYNCTGTMIIDDTGKIFVSDIEKFTPGPLLAMMCQAAIEAGEKICKQMKIEMPDGMLCMKGSERVLLKRAGKMVFVCVYDAKITKPEIFEEIEKLVQKLREG